MKTIVRATGVFGLASLLLAIVTSGPSRADERPAAPAFSEKDIFGKKTVALKDYAGKVVLLNFWATWCGPCKQEIPALKALRSSHQGQVEVIGVAVYSSDQDTEKYFKEQGIDYPVFYGSFELMEKYDRVRTIPTTFVIDRKGAIAAKVVGERNREQYEELIAPLLGR